MTSQQAFQVLQNKGTLIPGQSITVNKVNVQVERYLSQGGFAHVYLVRTATPIYNTTHHVLKRIAVANEAMLAEVKKEVDIMRLLKGHPNIVHLIDAAWHRMPDGLYEVFILMEYCAGGGIIDMMNRRLRERLTETEILQIFVDVCEGVAFMHNLRPALLHRDLKVENILQSSPTSFKLCDFGSATTVSSKAARTTQEIRTVEADLNRHTTLQYRAPEMIDLYLARRIDEKSDVWALGVLLYKLCYYTTPFEEHGPLAILNVQFRFPPYPMYSQDMIALIGSMLREHGSHRPSVFELLSRVHQLRGTKSKYHYSIPVAQPLSPQDQALTPQQNLPPQKILSPQSLHLQHQPHRAVPSPNSIQNSTQRQQSLLANSQISYSPSSRSPSRVHGQGIQAREKVLEAIAPMRRGRPETTPHTKTKAQQPGVDNTDSWTFPVADDGAWEIHTDGTREKQKGMAGEAWHTAPEGRTKAMEPSEKSSFGDDFGGKIWESTDLNNKQGDSKSAPNATPIIKTTAKPPEVPMTGSSRLQPQLQPRLRVNGTDAFGDLGLQSQHQKPAPTLGEARKLRTGLAAVNGGLERQDEKTHVVPRPSPSPRSSYMLQTPSLTPSLPNAATSNSGSNSPWRSSPQPTSRPSSSSARSDAMVMESRFPSLEELDANFPNSGYGDGKFGTSATTQLSKMNDTPQLPPRPNRRSSPNSGPSGALKPTEHRTLYSNDGVRSQQVTGTAMRDMRPVHIQGNSVKPKEQRNKTHYNNPAESSTERPSLVRKHPSSISMKHDPQIGSSTTIVMTMPPEGLRPATSRSKSPSRKPTPDWLTGTGDDQNVAPNPNTHTPPVLRDSPSKRASVIERSSYLVQEARVQHVPARTSSPLPLAQLAQDNVESPTVSRFNRVFPPVQPESPIRPNKSEVPEKGSASMARPGTETELDSSSSADEGPEDAGRLNHVPGRPKRGSGRPHRKSRQSSVHNLVDLWGGGTSTREKDESQELPQPTPDIIDLNDTGSRPTLGVELTFPSTSTAKTNHRSASPQPLGGGRPAQQFASTSVIASPVSSRSRPQSMIIFPSTKTIENNPSSLLDDRKPKANTRRTSITEMVQRYETIGGKPQNPGAPSTLSSSMLPPKPVGLKIATQTEAGVRSRNRSGTSLAPPNESAPPKGRASPTRHITRSSPVNLLPNNLPQRNQNVETSLRTRTTSAKLDPIRQSASHADVEASPKTDTVPSPERPYPGVNQLIVEWQRKAEAADPSRNKAPYRRGTASGIKRIEGQ